MEKESLEDYKGCEIYGFCNGYFGRDSYGAKTIVDINSRYMVVEIEDKTLSLVDFTDKNEEDILVDLSLWTER